MRTRRPPRATMLLLCVVAGVTLARADERPGAAQPDSLGSLFGPDLPVRVQDLPYGIGETATFEIGYGVIKAGEATIAVEDSLTYFGQNVLHVRTRARSNRFFDAFFKVRDQADSYIDADSLFTRYFFKHLREGDYERDVEIHFDQTAGVAYFPNGKSNAVPRGVHDVLSAFFRVRTLDLREGDVIELPTHGDKEMYDLEVVVVRREMRDTVLGRVRCVVVQPKLGDDTGLFKHQGDLFVWITDDDRRVPVLLKANVPVGAIEARLTSYQPPRARR